MRLGTRISKATFNPADAVLAFPELNSAAFIVGPNADGKAHPASCRVSENKAGRTILALLSSDLVNGRIGICEAVVDVVRTALRIDHLGRSFEHRIGGRYATTYRESKRR